MDLRSPAVLYVTDVEEDAVYERLPRSLNEILRPAMPGQLRRVRKNLFTVVAVVNPVTAGAARVVAEMLSIADQGLPLRLGLLFVTQGGQAALRTAPAEFTPTDRDHSNQNEAGNTMADDVGVTLLDAFEAALEAEDGDGQVALRWLNTLYARYPTGALADDAVLPALTEKAIRNSFVDYFSLKTWVSQIRSDWREQQKGQRERQTDREGKRVKEVTERRRDS